MSREPQLDPQEKAIAQLQAQKAVLCDELDRAIKQIDDTEEALRLIADRSTCIETPPDPWKRALADIRALALEALRAWRHDNSEEPSISGASCGPAHSVDCGYTVTGRICNCAPPCPAFDPEVA